MEKSESIAQLADALAKAQGEIENAKRDSENPFFKSKYADLASVRDACQGPLSKHGLAVVQTPKTEISENATIISVTTLLAHMSGEWVSGEVSAIPVKDDPQGIGSCITYLRRYGLQAITGVAADDDDGNAASNGERKPTGRPKAAPLTPTGDAEREGLMVSVKHAAKLLNSLGDVPPWTVKKCNDFANENFNTKGGVDGLTNSQLSEMAGLLSARIDELKKAPKDDQTETERKAKIAAIQKKYNPQAIAQAMKDTYPDDKLEDLTLDQLIRVEEEAIPF